MTKITILGEKPQKKELKKIEFVKCINIDGDLSIPIHKPSEYDSIQVHLRTKNHEYDLFICGYNDCGKYSARYLGHFNDGIV